MFHDGLDRLRATRAALAWYPDDVWLWLLGAQLQRISQEWAFVGRASETGDELGSAIVAARLVRELMRLCFLIERRYAPYSKWMGSAFAQLDVAKEIAGFFREACIASAYDERERRRTRSWLAASTPCAWRGRRTPSSASTTGDRFRFSTRCALPTHVSPHRRTTAFVGSR
jgi:hypothetical protein